MTTINGLLNTGRGALSAQKLALSVTGNNIANAASSTYTRQRLELSPTQVVTRGQGGQILSHGIAAGNVTRAFDNFTQGRILSEQSRSSFFSAQSSQTTAIEGMYNEAAEGGLRQSIDSYFSAVASVSASPEGTSERTVVLSNAETMAQRFHSVARSLSDARVALDNSVEESVRTVNELASELALLNQQIAMAEAGGGSAGNLRDRRESLVRQLAEEGNIAITETLSGSYTIHFADQVLVQEDRYNTLSAVPDPANGNLSDVVMNLSGASIDIGNTLTGGKLGGYLAMRDTTIVGYQTDLDNLAFDLINNVNTVHQAGFGLDGVSGRDFFTPLGTATNAAALISVDAAMVGQPDRLAASASAATLPGDNTNAVAWYQLSEQALVSGTYTFSQSASVQSSLVGADARALENSLEYQKVALSELQALKESISGVSTDEEATNMLKHQSAFEAAARFVSTVQKMMDTLLQL